MLLCYAIASIVNATVLLAAALVVSRARGSALSPTFTTMYVGVGTFIRPIKVSLALALGPFVRERTDDLSWPQFSLLLAPCFAVNAAVTAWAHGMAAFWLWRKLAIPLIERCKAA